VSPKVAFASPRGNAVSSQWLQRLRREPTCAKQREPTILDGPWLGIIGPHLETEVDLVPPYDLDMRIDDASATRYERVFLTIHVAKSLG
jgi:hypothetical protein